ncbi:hypothetical protein TIFTF001_014255, partial [Ficus carica]
MPLPNHVILFQNIVCRAPATQSSSSSRPTFAY